MTTIERVIPDPVLMKLGEPHRLTGDVRISFGGDGPARFRLQHARDDGEGRPDALSWCDVSDLAGQPTDANTSVPHGMFRATLIDVVRGDVDVVYHRYRADWIRVVPQDDEEAQRCQSFTVNIVPLQ